MILINKELRTRTMSEIQLYDYQQEIIDKLHDAFTRHTAVMCQMPTGTGKTVVLTTFIKDIVGEVWIIAHRRELVEQINAHIAKIIGMDERIKVMSIQWLSKHYDEMKKAPAFIIIDEAHHSLADTYKEMWTRYPNTKKLGMTATPCRLNGASFIGLYKQLVWSQDIKEFIKQGYLAAFDYATIKADSEDRKLVDSLSKKGADGDYQVKEMVNTFNNRPTIERLYKSVRQLAEGKKGIVYAINIDHAHDIAEYYSEQGLKAVAIDSKTPNKERAQLVEAFREGKLDVLVNVDIFSEGFDCPDVEFIQLARPTLSLSKYFQMIGRGLRVAKGKKACIIIDNVGMYSRFGLPIHPVKWVTLWSGKKFVDRKMSTATGKIIDSSTVKEIDTVDLEIIVDHEILQEQLMGIHRVSKKLPRIRVKAVQGLPYDPYYLYKNNILFSNQPLEQVFGTTEYCAVGVKYKDARNVIDIVYHTETVAVRLPYDFISTSFLNNDYLAVHFSGHPMMYIDLKTGELTDNNQREIKAFKFGEVFVKPSVDGMIRLTTRTRTQMSWIVRQDYSDIKVEECSFYTKITCKIPDERFSKFSKNGEDVDLIFFFDDVSTCYFMVEELSKNYILVIDHDGELYAPSFGQYAKRLFPKGSKTTRQQKEEKLAFVRKEVEKFEEFIEQNPEATPLWFSTDVAGKLNGI